MLEIIELTVRGQALTANKRCVASGLVNEIECRFDTDWEVDEIRAIFYNSAGRGERTSVVVSNGICMVPPEVLKTKGAVYVNLVGSVVEGDELIKRMTSYKACIVEVQQKVFTDGTNTATPTPSEFEQFIETVDEHIAEHTLPDAPSDGKQYARQNGAWAEVEGGGGGTSDYEDLSNKPKINGVTLSGEKSLDDIGTASKAYVDAEVARVEAEIPSLGDYYTKTQTDAAISGYHDSTKADQSTTYTKTEVDAVVADAIGGAINGSY